ncbi:AraC family transcriptional regulator [Acuticoccus sediminis]|uniref:AraC family transcriptional regulator n=1 Tax=Acuticoccus sediminis TaxID=2184697 RepID=A0A8B2NV91_9HYPH|nr:AraC family transcriptional regulator [Acuticoccus sediminis]RAH99556.1 AraC family transcriptional regulator [Acuticoccus sediminis]
MTDDLSDLAARAVALATPGANVPLLDGVALFSATSTDSSLAMFYEPMACIVLQGEMEVTIGAAVLDYAPGTCFVGSIDLPVTGRITRASVTHPYLALSVTLGRDALADLMAESPRVSVERGKCYAFGPVPSGVLDACGRLLSLQGSPDDVAVIGPMIRREMMYRLLRGPQAAALHQIIASDPKLAQVRRALTWIREHIDESVPIHAMATCAGMSDASFHRHFRAATGMSPLQYQKSLRLQAARRAILAGAEVAHAAFDVGYQSASQFSREYSRMFGLAPSRDVKRLLDAGGTEPAGMAPT